MSLTHDPKPLSEVVEATIFLLTEFSLNLISLEITDGVTRQLEAKKGHFTNWIKNFLSYNKHQKQTEVKTLLQTTCLLYTHSVIKIEFIFILNFNHALGKANNCNMMQKLSFLWMRLEMDIRNMIMIKYRWMKMAQM